MVFQEPVTFSLANSLIELDRLHAELEQIGEAWKLAPKLILQLNLALDELFTNVVNYGLDTDSQQRVVFTIHRRNDVLEIVMSDEGKAFNPTEPADPDFDVPLEDKEIGGLGIFLVRKCSDTISYSRENGKNIVTLTKKI